MEFMLSSNSLGVRNILTMDLSEVSTWKNSFQKAVESTLGLLLFSTVFGMGGGRQRELSLAQR